MGLKRKTPLKRTPIKKTPWDKAKKEQEKKKAKAGLSKSKLRDKLDAVFSKYIRLKYSDDKGYCRCISCGKVFPWKEIQNGHYMSRRYMSTRFSEDNCRPQNRSSNRFSGEKDHYTFIKNLRAEIGEERFERIERLKDSTGEDSETFYHLQYDTYKHLFQELLFERGLSDPWKSKRY